MHQTAQDATRGEAEKENTDSKLLEPGIQTRVRDAGIHTKVPT